MQVVFNKNANEISVIVERQNVNSEAIKALQQRLYDRGPTAPHQMLDGGTVK